MQIDNQIASHDWRSRRANSNHIPDGTHILIQCHSPSARSAFPPPAYAHWLDYTVYEDGRAIGSRSELRCFWSITAYVDPKLGIKTHGRTGSLGYLGAGIGIVTPKIVMVGVSPPPLAT
jgi:hypothetical protein